MKDPHLLPLDAQLVVGNCDRDFGSYTRGWECAGARRNFDGILDA